MLIRKEKHTPASTVAFRHLWGTAKRQELLETTDAETPALYQTLSPSLELGLPYVRTVVGADYHRWPQLLDLLPTSFPGVKTSRDEFLVSIDREALETRVRVYFEAAVGHDQVRLRFPVVMAPSGRFDPIKTRQYLCKRGMLPQNVVRYAYRPFDVRWVYWDPETKRLDEKRPEYWEHVNTRNLFLSAGARNRKEVFYQPQVTSSLADHHLVESNVGMFPLYLREHAGNGGDVFRANLPQSLRTALKERELPVETIFRHVTAILHAPSYHAENAGALRMDWPRVPVTVNAEQLCASADLGMALATLLDVETAAAGISRGKVRPGLRLIALPHKQNGKALTDDDLSLSAGWGHVQTSRTRSKLVMPGLGLRKERDYTPTELTALAEEAKALGISCEEIQSLLGKRTFDVYLNTQAMWSNVPAHVWAYMLGGYPVIKKWL
jgi:hypothetical protein